MKLRPTSPRIDCKAAVTVFGIFSVFVFLTLPGLALAATPHHIHIALSHASEAVKWYEEHMGCEAIEGRSNAVDCGTVEIGFVLGTTQGGSAGSGIDHIGFSVVDLQAKMNELEKVGVRGSGVRLQRFDDGSLVRDIPSLFKIAFIFDPWGTRIELVQDAETLGFHHIHLNSVDPAATLQWYQEVLGGTPASLKGMLDGLLFDDIWLQIGRASCRERV